MNPTELITEGSFCKIKWFFSEDGDNSVITSHIRPNSSHFLSLLNLILGLLSLESVFTWLIKNKLKYTYTKYFSKCLAD